MKQLPENKAPRIWRTLIHFIGWGIVFAFPIFMNSRSGNSINWIAYLHYIGLPVAFCLVFYINYFLLIPRFLFNRQIRNYFLLCLLLLLIVASGQYLWQSLFSIPPPFKRPDHPGPPIWIFLVRDFISMAFVSSLSVAIRMSLRWSKVERERQEAEKSKTEAELKNLKNQLNPHFLLNTLNNIYALISFDTDKAQQAVQELSKLLRYVLYDNRTDFVPLHKEAEFIHNYIELMKIRLTDNVKLETRIDILPNSTTLIAPLIFISLIENAFKHGVSSTEQGFISIQLSENRTGEVCCEISNSNYPKSSADKSGSGIGLEQVGKRLELLYPGAYKWERHLSSDGRTYTSKLTILSNPHNRPYEA